MEQLKQRLAEFFWFTLAILFLIESWIWDHVKEWLRQLERLLGLERFESWLKARVEPLSPQMTLALFAIPMIGVLPFKLAAVALLGQGHVVTGIIFIFLVKSLTLGVEAFLFDICRDKLLQMAWFARLYSIVLDIRAWATLMVKPFKLQALTAWNRIRDQAQTLMVRDGGELKRRIARLRDAVRQRPRG
ncbi:hypothetical protein [Methylocystis echinoides]|uniref:Transmembrane protein n=1 Tax=Methylocystis echinoides TaxID=29468 RepID=A0A9W6LQY1_9HYPH|nr:hypothetical protein [Methylocystis echinoides]GLI91719.1 hypothetical protein LMG27198_07110 [Methylocystis echinoides]